MFNKQQIYSWNDLKLELNLIFILFNFKVLKIATEDLKALEDFISNKKYLFGDHPCVEDAVVFAWTCQFLYVDTGPLNKHFTSKHLVEYIKLMKLFYFIIKKFLI